MSVTGPRLPSPTRIVSAIDEAAQRTVKRGQDAVVPIVASETPRGRTGKVAATLRPRVSKTGTGFALNVRASRGAAHDRWSTVAQVVRWLNQGTGIYRQGGGDKKPIRPNRRWRPNAAMVLPGGKRVRKVRGQKPQPFMDRIHRRGTPVVERIFRDGARDAAKAIERNVH